jgi:hypothetical protein
MQSRARGSWSILGVGGGGAAIERRPVMEDSTGALAVMEDCAASATGRASKDERR